MSFNSSEDLNEIVKTINKSYDPRQYKEKIDLTKLNFDNPNNSLKIINQIKIMFEQEQNFNKFAIQ